MKAEQIVTLKVTYEDNACALDAEKDCCGVGKCANRRPAPEQKVLETMRCCGAAHSVEVLTSSPIREVIDEDTFKK